MISAAKRDISKPVNRGAQWSKEAMIERSSDRKKGFWKQTEKVEAESKISYYRWRSRASIVPARPAPSALL
jgi:hypothetical protein